MLARPVSPTAAQTTRILGVPFFQGSLEAACAQASAGGLLTAPSGPGMACDLVTQPEYRRALQASDLVLTDSAFMVLLWRLRTGRRLPRNSGLAFLRIWMNRDVMREPGAVLWIMPTEAERAHTHRWLSAAGLPVHEDDFYVAPEYADGAVLDWTLLRRIEARRPKVVYVAIGGGVQERLGVFLRHQLSYTPLILCLGAALAFITGAQVRIAPWVDRCGLGWLWRIASDPARYGRRYIRAVKLAWMILRFGTDAPPCVEIARASSH